MTVSCATQNICGERFNTSAGIQVRLALMTRRFGDGGSTRIDQLSQLEHGTLVLWEKPDRLVGDVRANDTRARRQFLKAVRAVEEHVAMVFHRFMTQPNPISIWLNSQRVEPWDPFLADESATQRLSSEAVGPPGAQVTVEPYVLPHHTRLSVERHRIAGGPAGWNAQQGFYVYRNRRLLLAGDWLGLGFRKEEHYKLARIQVDLPNSFDHEWDIDIRKSRARPPLALRDEFRRIARITRDRAVTVYRHRGKTIARSARNSPVFVWQRRVRERKVSYVVNREHPLVSRALSAESIDAHELEQLLRLIEEYIPVQQIWVDAAEGDETQGQPFEAADSQEIIGMIQALYRAYLLVGLSHSEALGRLATTEVIGERYELVEEAVKALGVGVRS